MNFYTASHDSSAKDTLLDCQPVRLIPFIHSSLDFTASNYLTSVKSIYASMPDNSQFTWALPANILLFCCWCWLVLSRVFSFIQLSAWLLPVDDGWWVSAGAEAEWSAALLYAAMLCFFQFCLFTTCTCLTSCLLLSLPSTCRSGIQAVFCHLPPEGKVTGIHS